MSAASSCIGIFKCGSEASRFPRRNGNRTTGTVNCGAFIHQGTLALHLKILLKLSHLDIRLLSTVLGRLSLALAS